MRVLVCAALLAVLGCGAVDADDTVHPDPASVKPLAMGAQVPSARVATPSGEPIDLADVTRKRGALIVFYRGGW